MASASEALSVAIGGLGAIGLPVARRLDAGIEGLRLAAVAARDRGKAEAKMKDFRTPVPVLGLAELAEHADVVVECTPAACFLEAAEPAIAGGRVLVTVSPGALLSHMELVERARKTGARIIVATGALLGLDAVRAAAEGAVSSVRMVTRKPPAGLAGLLHGGQQQGDQDADDGDHHQQFDERETSTVRGAPPPAATRRAEGRPMLAGGRNARNAGHGKPAIARSHMHQLSALKDGTQRPLESLTVYVYRI